MKKELDNGGYHATFLEMSNRFEVKVEGSQAIVLDSITGRVLYLFSTTNWDGALAAAQSTCDDLNAEYKARRVVNE